MELINIFFISNFIMTADSLEILATHRDLVQMHQRIHQVTMEMMIYTVRFLALVLFIKKNIKHI